MQATLTFLEGFWTWHTPLSFLGGIGTHYLYVNYWRDRKDPTVFSKKSDGTYRFSARFWVYSVIATMIICWIGYRTQDTANKVEDQAQRTEQFAMQTNDCLNQVIATLKDRSTYNAQLDDLVNRRTLIWTEMVIGLNQLDATLDVPAVSSQTQTILQTFFAKNAAIDAERKALLVKRTETAYPDPSCGQDVP